MTPPLGILSLEDECEQLPLTEAEEQSLIGHDISRLPPRVFRNLPAAVAALRMEIRDLLRKDQAGSSALVEIPLTDPEYGHLPKVFTTVVAKTQEHWYLVSSKLVYC